MSDLLKNCRISVGDAKNTPFVNANDIYQDGTTPFCRVPTDVCGV